MRESRLSGAEDERSRICFEGGRANDSELSPAAAALLELIAGASDLGEAVARYAELVEASSEQVTRMVARFVSGLLVLDRG